MKCVLNGQLKEYSNKRRTDKTRTNLTETTLKAPEIFTQIKQSIKRTFLLKQLSQN